MVLRLEYGTLLEHQGFLMQGLHMVYLFVFLQLPKKSDPPTPPDFDIGQGSIVNNMHSDHLQEVIHPEVCHSFRSIYTELFQHIDMREWKITSK